MGSPAPEQYSFAPFDPAAAAEIASETGLSLPVATVLARRGIGTPQAVREFLAAEDEHPPAAFPQISDAVGLVRGAIAAGGLITVHGDYDADGVCATAILVEALRSQGAECDWFIPSRIEDGYGLADSLPDRLAERGTRLLITVDCGISSAAVIEAVRGAGIEAIVTDHHQPPAELPGCPVLHPAIGYPFAGLCGAGVASKLAEALAGEPRGVDLAALATIADSVPLLGENRRIVRAGLREMTASPRPGIRALMSVASVEPESLEARDVAFRLAPRINAAGRLYRADAGVELLLAGPERASEIAGELDRANSERRAIESEVVAAAERQATAQLAAGEQHALVLAGDGWHPGVVGIAASRIVDKHGLPALLISVAPDDVGTGSGRSVPGVDLLAALGECSGLLRRFGGHAAAAGLEVDAGRIEELRRQFSDAVGAQADTAPIAAGTLDGVLGVAELDLALARELERLGPFGAGNPEPRFMVKGAQAEDVRPMGEEGRHARLMLRAGTQRAAAVAFGVGDEAAGWAGAKLDVAIRVEVNNWNGSVSARAVIESALPALASIEQPCCAPAHDRPEEFLHLVADALTQTERPGAKAEPGAFGRSAGRRLGRPALAGLADLLTSGREVVIVTADARRRAGLAGDVAHLAASEPRIVCSRCGGPLPKGDCILITDWATLAASPEAIGAEVVAAIDPPPGEQSRQAALGGIDAAVPVFELWGPAESDFALACFRDEWDTRANAASIYRALRAGGESVSGLAAALSGERTHGRTPAAAARALNVLAEVGLIEIARDPSSGGALLVRVVSSVRTDLEDSAAYRRYRDNHQAGESFLSRQQRRAA